jgi:hypothetical protein
MAASLDKETAEIPAVQFGPKMSALPAKRRALVCALFDDDAPAKGAGLLPWAAKRAAYGTLRRGIKLGAQLRRQIEIEPGRKSLRLMWSLRHVRQGAPRMSCQQRTARPPGIFRTRAAPNLEFLNPDAP